MEAVGFAGRIHQARHNSNLTATISRGNAQLEGSLTDPNTGMPYDNLAVQAGDDIIDNGWLGSMPVEPGGSFLLPGVINFNVEADGSLLDAGEFTTANGFPDQYFPGAPASDTSARIEFTNSNNLAIEHTAWLDLPAGEFLIGVNNNDAVELAFHPNDARDIFRERAVSYDSNTGYATRTTTLTVEEAGLYPVRVLLAHWTGAVGLEFFTAPVDNPEARVLVNDLATEGAIAAYSAMGVTTRPYVTAVSPVPDASGVLPGASIEVTMQNLGGAMPVMRVDGEEVSYTNTADGDTTTLSYSPAAPFPGASSVAVELDYGSASAAWSFNVQTGRKALLITGGGTLNSGDGWVSQRLSSQFGFDVTVASDASVTVADGVDADLIYNSSTVISGNVRGEAFEQLDIPFINCEQANLGDFKLIDAGGGSGAQTITNFVIDNNSHPITEGLPLGSVAIFTSGIEIHWGNAPATGVHLASPQGQAARGALYVIEEGETVNTDIGAFVHPARRAHLGFGNDGAGSLTAEGVAVFDNLIEWLLAKPVPEQQPVITQAEYDPEAGQFTISWLSIPGRFYIIEVHQRLTGIWGDLNDSFEAASDISTFNDSEAGDYGGRFYRIRLIPLAE